MNKHNAIASAERVTASVEEKGAAWGECVREIVPRGGWAAVCLGDCVRCVCGRWQTRCS